MEELARSSLTPLQLALSLMAQAPSSRLPRAPPADLECAPIASGVSAAPRLHLPASALGRRTTRSSRRRMRRRCSPRCTRPARRPASSSARCGSRCQTLRPSGCSGARSAPRSPSTASASPCARSCSTCRSAPSAPSAPSSAPFASSAPSLRPLHPPLCSRQRRTHLDVGAVATLQQRLRRLCTAQQQQQAELAEGDRDRPRSREAAAQQAELVDRRSFVKVGREPPALRCLPPLHRRSRPRPLPAPSSAASLRSTAVVASCPPC